MRMQTTLCKGQEENCAPTKHYIRPISLFPLHSHSLEHDNFLPPSPPNKHLALSRHLNTILMNAHKTRQCNAPAEFFKSPIKQKYLIF